MKHLSLLLILLPTVYSSLQLDLYSNTALSPPAASSQLIPSLSFAFPPAPFFSAEVTGTLSPLLATAATTFSFACSFSGLTQAFVFIDDHLICQLGAYNNSANGVMDTANFTLRSKQSQLPVRAQLLAAAPSTAQAPAAFAVQWCLPGAAACGPLPSAALAPALPPPEQSRRALQRGLLQGWGSWLHRDMLSLALLPDAALLGLQLCHLPTGLCLQGSQIDGNGGWLTPRVRVGAHPPTHAYSQAWVAFLLLNVSLEYAPGATDSSALDLLLTPAPDCPANLSDYAVAFTGRFAWGRLGEAAVGGNSSSSSSSTLAFQGAGLARRVVLWGVDGSAGAGPTLPLPPSALPPLHLQGTPGGLPCTASRDCSSELCSSATGLCAAATPLPYFALRLGSRGVGLSTAAVSGSGSSAALQALQLRLAAARDREWASYARYGSSLVQATAAATAALGWRHIYVPCEAGPLLPVTYGFSWISPAPTSNDHAYVTFEWDNALASFSAGVLGYREAAYSNLIQQVKSKSAGGFLPNWASGGSKASQAEPAVASRVLLELWRTYQEPWLVELLLDDLLDHSAWQWERRRVVVPGSACCDAPGFITLGGDASACASAAECVGAFRGESGLDQSPLWDCPGAAPDGSGGNCSLLWSPASQPHLLQLGDVQSTALFCADARALAELAEAVGRGQAALLLRQRGEAMAQQLALRTWDAERGAFFSVYTATGAWNPRLAPTTLYPLLARAATLQQVQQLVARHLLNASELCVSLAWGEGGGAAAAAGSEGCYWGLPSISASDASFMQPLGYVYWRGLVWGPMNLLAWWSLKEYEGLDAGVDGARRALAAQQGAQVVEMWNRHRHVCENYSPFRPNSTASPGTGTDGLPKSNGECTGWEFYTWGALGAVLQILEAQGAAAGGRGSGSSA